VSGSEDFNTILLVISALGEYVFDRELDATGGAVGWILFCHKMSVGT